MKRDMTRGTLCAVCSALVFGVTPVLASITFEMGSNALTLTFYRNALAVPVLLAVLLIRRVDLRISLKDFSQLALISILFSVTTTYILYDAYQYIGVGLSTTLHFLYPMCTVLLGWILFRQRPDRVKILSLIIATAGVALATGSSDAYAVKGILLAVASALTYAGYLLGIEHTAIGRMDSMKSMFYMCIVNAAAVAVFDLPSGNVVYGLSPLNLLLTFVLAVANSVFAYVLLIAGIKLIGAGNAAIFSMLEPVSGVVFGVLFLSEKLPPLKLISCILILGAVSMPIIRDRRAEGSEDT
ncbi:MAG: DMT family transporter [Emergencia sp.]